MSIKLQSDNNTNNNEKQIQTEQKLKEKIYQLKDRITELELEKKNNLLTISKLTVSKNEYTELEKKNQSLKEDLVIKEELISELKNIIIKEQKDKNEEKRILENDFDSKLIYYKRIQDTNDYKESAASSVIKLNEVQHYSIIQLENKIDSMKKEYEDILKKKELDFENKYTELKKNMMEFLKNAQKNMFKNNKRNLELNTKLGILYKNEMLNELENQSRLIEDLIKEKEKQKKEITLLKQELLIHKKVEEMINNKNNKFLNIINKINIKINKKKDELNSTNFQKEKNFTAKKLNICMKDPKKRAKSVKNYKINYFKQSAATRSDYYNNNTSNSNDILNKNIIDNCRTPSGIKINHDFSSVEINEENNINNNNYNNFENKSEIFGIINDIVNSCCQALKIILKENKLSQIFKDNSFVNDFDIKLDFSELNNSLKYELLIGIITKVLNFLKTYNNYNIKEENDSVFNIDKKKSELLKLNDEYNLQFSRQFENENYNKIKQLKLKNQKLKYEKLINVIGINNNKRYSSTQKNLFRIKKSNILYQKEKNNLFNSFEKNESNLLKRYIHISNSLANSLNKQDINFNNNTFFKH